MSLLALTGFAVLGAIVLLTMHEIGPLIVHRPIILGPLFAAALGDPAAGFAIGAIWEWIWTDRIPAGGIRTPAASVGTVAGILAWAGLAEYDPAPARYSIALVVAAGYVAAYVPFDGGLRRLWNVASENVIAALERGSLLELTALLPVALVLRVAVLSLGLAAAAPAARGLWLFVANDGATAALAAIPWHWTIAAAVVALLLRVGGGAWAALFALGAVAGWLL